MTFILAKKFGNFIYLVGDTMMSRPNSGRPNVIPGQLKIVVLALNFTAAFAGNEFVALEGVRKARQILKSEGNLSAAVEALRIASSDGSAEFLAAYHAPEPHLVKIAKGCVTVPLESGWLGDPLPLKELARPTLPSTQLRYGSDLADADYNAGADFVGHFTRTFHRFGTSWSEVAGGFPVVAFGFPRGHTYSNQAQVYAWDRITIPTGVTAEQLAAQKSGATSFSLHQVSPAPRGVAVLGMYMDQIGMGWLYDPINWDDPIPLKLGLPEFADRVRERALDAGGVIVD